MNYRTSSANLAGDFLGGNPTGSPTFGPPPALSPNFGSNTVQDAVSSAGEEIGSRAEYGYLKMVKRGMDRKAGKKTVYVKLDAQEAE